MSKGESLIIKKSSNETSFGDKMKKNGDDGFIFITKI